MAAHPNNLTDARKRLLKEWIVTMMLPVINWKLNRIFNKNFYVRRDYHERY